jgi:hypothetical protein
MIIFKGKDYRPATVEVGIVEPYAKSDQRHLELTATANPELETGAVVKVCLSELDAQTLCDYLCRALGRTP